MPNDKVRILLVDDDEDQYLLVLELLWDIVDFAFTLEWVPTYAAALQSIERAQHDIYLIDYHLGTGQPTGLELVRTAVTHGTSAPLIVLTADDSRATDLAVMQAGATDYLMKQDITGRLLERAIRYALRHTRSQAALRAAKDELEQRVAERTLALQQVNLQLQSELNERKRVEEEWNRFFTLSVDMLCIATFAGYFIRLNPAWEHTLGFTIAELTAEPLLHFVHLADRELTQDAIKQLIAGQDVVFFTNRYRCKDGTYKWFEWKATSLPAQQLIYAVARDITDRKRLEAQFLQAQKMESIGRLAGGVAHDFNNILTAIIGFTALVQDELTPDALVQNDLAEIEKAAQRATALTQQLLAFAREQIIAPRVLMLNNLILDMDKLLRRLIGEDIELITLPLSNLWHVKADPSQIEQVIVNLAVNARDAMPNGGKLTIETQNIDLDVAYALQHLGAKPGRYVLLSISDTGTGMSAEVQQHLFEPFFTTKERGKGTGLGLAMCYGIVKQHGGYVWAYSTVGQGTRIEIYLPQVDEEAEELPSYDNTHGALWGTETVLLVEDEEAVRALTARLLRDHGYKVLAASNGSEAFGIAKEYIGTIHLLLTDVVMPRMNGKVLAERLATLRPDAKVLFMSGYTENVIVRHGRLESGVAYLQKPFTPITLMRAVRKVLDV